MKLPYNEADAKKNKSFFQNMASDANVQYLKNIRLCSN